jgi:hypothetical protein
MCSFIDLIVNGVVVTQQVDCGKSSCPASDASTGGTDPNKRDDKK